MSDISSTSHQQALSVELGDRSYPIWIGDDVSEQMFNAIKEHGGTGALVIDENVGATVANENLHAFSISPARSGEMAKSMAMLGEIYEFMAEKRVARDGYLVAVGGGVIGDLGGFAAASYLRGIDFFQVPTTLLAMVDSSVGGKTGINIRAGKNLVGAFWQPKAVFISTSFLRTLPSWEFSAGMAEVIKYGMLYDPALFDQLMALETPLDWQHPALPAIIRRCCEIKAEIVKADEKETAASGGRALLNLGHTFAHAIENAAGYGTYLHGEAVGAGLMLAARLSEELTKHGRPGYAYSSGDVANAKKLIAQYELPTDLRTSLRRETPQPPPELRIDTLMAAMKRDKKVKGGKLRFVAMEAQGRAVTVDQIDEELVINLWREAGAIG
ncbi:MAG: 3-dehydroquinate synthase [Verrucomicrobiota bacterium]